MLNEGTKAPDFKLPDDHGNEVSLSDFKGKKVVLYFYPKDNTPGCTREACGFRDVYNRILEKGAVVIGISADTTDSHAKFRETYDLPFFLLSDKDRTVIREFGTWGEKKIYGKIVEGLTRSTFIIDENGMISKVFPSVKPDEHAEQVLEQL